MSEIIKVRWLTDNEKTKVAPKTLASQIYNEDGTLFKDQVNTSIEELSGSVSELIGDTAVSEQINTALERSKANWEQNNPAAHDYIANRTHWVEDDGETYHTLDEKFLPETIATKGYVENLYTKLNSNTILGFYCIEDVTIITNGIAKTYPANSNVQISFIEDDVFEIVPTSNNSILSLTSFPSALATYYPWLEGVKQFSNILFDMNTEDMYTKWSQGNQGAYQVQFAQYNNCIFWSDNPYISEVTKRTNYTLFSTSQLPLCYSTIPDNTFKAFYLAFGVNSDPNWSNPAYTESFAKATWATQAFSYYGARIVGFPGHFTIELPKDCRGLMFDARNVEAAGTFDATNTTNFGAKSGSWREAFGDCTSLRRLYIKNLKVNLNISWSPVDYNSIYYIISEATNTSKITISVSPYTYNLLSESDFELAASKNITIALLTENYVEDKRLSVIADKADKSYVDEKLDDIAESVNQIVVDSELSDTSTNSVQNKVIYAKLEELTDMTPVSEQIATAIANKVEKVDGKGLSTNDYTTTDKNKLAGIAAGAEVNQNAFSNISVGSTTISADTKTDTLTLVAGSNVTITPDATNDKITIAATDTIYTHPTYTAKNSGLYKITVDGTGHVSGATAVAKSDITALGIPAQDTTYSNATTDKAGLMSATDKATLDALDSYVGDKKVSDAVDEAFDNAITGLSVSGKVITYTKGDGSTGTITTQDTDTKYTHPTTSGNKHIPSGGESGQILRWSADGTAAWGADNNTTYSAGTGISLSGTTFSNSGVRSVATGSANGTISVNTNGTSVDVAVKGLGSAAYTASTAYDEAGAASTALTNAKAYTDAEITEWVGDKTVATQVSAGVAQANKYTDDKIDALVGEGASTTLDTIGEIAAAIEDNQDMIDTLNSAIANKSDVGHEHNYAGSASKGGPANSVKTNLTVKLNGGSTEGTNLFTYNGSTAKAINITPSAIGAAASSHGTHVEYSTTAPVMDGTASVGSASTVARSDHKHPTDTSRAAASDLTALQNLVGDKKVSEQIAAAQLVYVGPTKPTDPNIKVWINTAEEGTGVIPVMPRISTINLSKNSWSGSSSPYYQTVSINTVTSATKVELNPTVSQIVSLQNDDIALMAQNDAGNVTIYSFGGKPSADMEIQVTLTEVSYV